MVSEGEKFLEYMTKCMRSRPNFSIFRDEYQPFLRIEYGGSTMSVPLAEVLAFARTTEEEARKSMDEARASGLLALYPYPVFDLRIRDIEPERPLPGE
jgi:hypothetical protein